MTLNYVFAKSREKARKKATTRFRVVKKIVYVKGSKEKGNIKMYEVITKPRKK